MINYKTKDKGMKYTYNNVNYEIYHDYFRVNDFVIDGSNIKMSIQNFNYNIVVNPFYDVNIEINKGDIIKVAYIIDLEGNLRVHGYELSTDMAINSKLLLLPYDVVKELPKSQEVKALDLYNYICGIINNISNSNIKSLVFKIILAFKEELITWPAAVSVHHNIKGGLILHTANVLRTALSISRLYSDINIDYIISGAVLHDIGKIQEYTNDGKISDLGKYRDHISLGQEIISNFKSGIDITDRELLPLYHIIASHHGKLEYGSTKIPSTKEAFVVHIADYIDSHMYMYHESYKNVSFGETEYNKYLGTFVINESIKASKDYDKFD